MNLLFMETMAWEIETQKQALLSGFIKSPLKYKVGYLLIRYLNQLKSYGQKIYIMISIKQKVSIICQYGKLDC